MKSGSASLPIEPPRPRLFVGNFEFEYHLSASPIRELSHRLKQINRRLLPELVCLTRPGDFLWVNEPLDRSNPADQHLLSILAQRSVTACWQQDMLPPSTSVDLAPWGWTRRVIEWGQKLGLKTSCPELSVIRWANSRITSVEYEQESATVPAGVRAIEQFAQLTDHLLAIQPQSRWLIKTEFSMSSRDRLIGHANTLTSAQLNWIRKRLERRERLVFEPWLDRVGECSFHYQIDHSGKVEQLGMMEVLVDENGRFLGNQPFDHSTGLNWEASQKCTARLAAQFAQAGYFGPLSIDSMCYRDRSGQLCQRPLQDINARYTMGRCALERNQSWLD